MFEVTGRCLWAAGDTTGGGGELSLFITHAGLPGPELLVAMATAHHKKGLVDPLGGGGADCPDAALCERKQKKDE